MKVFITGNKGFIGSSLTKNFQNKVIIVVNDQIDKNINSFDILEKDQFKNIKEDIDAIIHLAAKTSIANSIKNPYETYYTNVFGTLNILEFAKEKKIQKIINISTYVYGKPLYLPIDEKHPLNPHTPYNKSKILSEEFCKYYSEDCGIDIVTLRPFYIYGPMSNQFSFIPSAIRQIEKNGKVFLSEKNTKRDFLFIDDFTNLISKILDKFPKGYNVYNVGYGKSYSLEEIVKIIEKTICKEICIVYDKSIRPNDVNDMVADISKVSESFDWKPCTNIEQGIKSFIQNRFHR